MGVYDMMSPADLEEYLADCADGERIAVHLTEVHRECGESHTLTLIIKPCGESGHGDNCCNVWNQENEVVSPHVSYDAAHFQVYGYYPEPFDPWETGE